MKRYLEHVRSKSPHERRQHAWQLAAGITAVVFVVWISTLGLRFATTPPQTADSGVSQLANVLSNGGAQNATLLISTSTGY